MHVLAGVVVVAFAVFLVGLAALIAFRPHLAERVLRSFAGSARAHYTEQSLRVIAGAALASFAPWMHYPHLFTLFGWMLVVTSLTLLLLPWRWHHEFGTRALPLIVAHRTLFAFGALALGTFLFYGISRVVVHR